MLQLRTWTFPIALVMAAQVAAAPAAAAPSIVEPRMLVSAGCANGAVYAVASDRQGNVAAAGYCGDLNGAFRTFVVKLDRDGTVVWTHRPEAAMRPANLAFDAAGSVIVAGQIGSATTTVGAVLKISSTGVPAWTRTVPPATPGNMSCASVATDADDAVFVSCGGSSPAAGAVVSYQSDGSDRWRTDAFDSTQSLTSANGRLYAASSTNVRIIDRATGAVITDARVSEAGSARVGLDGKVYVKSGAAGQAGGAIAIYDQALNALGSVTLKSALGAVRSYDYFDVDAAGNIYVLGAYYATPDLTGGGQYVAAFNASGDPQWQSAAEPSATYGVQQSPSSLNGALGGSLVSVSSSGKCYFSTYQYLLELPAR
jgi:outer membrane protein assembly factor BamB